METRIGIVNRLLPLLVLGLMQPNKCSAKPLNSRFYPLKIFNIEETQMLSSGAFIEDCGWTGMTKNSVISEKSVQQEYLRCSSGRIKWLNPEGAVQIAFHVPRNFNYLLESSNSSKASPKRLCLTFDPQSFKQIQLYLQKGHNLELVHAPSQSYFVRNIRKCYDMKDNVARLFMEKSLINTEEISPRFKRANGARPTNLIRIPSVGAAELIYNFE